MEDNKERCTYTVKQLCRKDSGCLSALQAQGSWRPRIHRRNQKKTTSAGERGDADVQVAFLLCNCRALGGSESIDENRKKTTFAYHFFNVLRTVPGQNIATVLEPVAKRILPTPPFNPQIQCCLGLCGDAVYCNIQINSHGPKDHVTKTIQTTLRSNKSKQTPQRNGNVGLLLFSNFSFAVWAHAQY